MLATFPVVLPFVLSEDARFAMHVSQAIAVAMLFVAGFTLGRHAGHAHPFRSALFALLLGVALIAAIKALGG